MLEGNDSMPKIAKRFSVSHKLVQELKYQWRDLGTLQPQTHKVGRKPLLSQDQRQRLDAIVRADPSLTLEQLRSKLRVQCSLTTIWKQLRLLGHTHKKSKSMPASSNGPMCSRSV